MTSDYASQLYNYSNNIQGGLVLVVLKEKDIKVFWNNRTGDFIIANDYKMRRLMVEGVSLTKAKKESHGHMKCEKDALKIKDNILANKRTVKRDLWTLGCYMRVTDKTYKYYNWTKGLHETKLAKGRNENYFNPNKGTV